ncbi:tetratricopeptide repeat protein [Streptomyces sp. CB03238]|uniref:tetratricopeptide repeat protein n=1 Tax=Streptomyces sp. CB03238 TaxID=1907777 RepID=UPI000A10FDDD|nr:tetratricopeptide repeat protein [Streptomyces sp. CB03238]ORT53360.1 hypothetical protein BKD26_38570 [Streptomyces sp. CB03238]
MGELHNMPFMCMDAHREQFRGVKSEMWVFDLHEHSWPLYRNPSVAQCATMLVPLLSFFDAKEFHSFSVGYTTRRGDAGRNVINLIQYGDRTGWKLSYDRKLYALAIERVNAQIGEDEEAGHDPKGTQLSLLGTCYSRLNRHADAILIGERMLTSINLLGPGAPAAMFNLGQWYYRAGEIDQAIEAFRKVVQLESERLIAPELLDTALAMIKRCTYHSDLERLTQ